MRFYTKEECESWLIGLDRKLPTATDGAVVSMKYPSEPHRIFTLSHWIATSMTHRMPVLLWISEWGIWPSSENWHLYYKLRHAYGDQALLHESPGHLFLGHEMEDLASFLQIAILNGWGGHVLSKADYLNAFFSHDEYIDFFAANEKLLDDVNKMIDDHGFSRI